MDKKYNKGEIDYLKFSNEIAYQGKIGQMREEFCVRHKAQTGNNKKHRKS